jgi:hypothetical protein
VSAICHELTNIFLAVTEILHSETVSDSVPGGLTLVADPIYLVNSRQIVKIELLEARSSDFILEFAQNYLVGWSEGSLDVLSWGLDFTCPKRSRYYLL